MKHLYQPVFDYEKEIYGRKLIISYSSSIVYETEERARLRSKDIWNDIVTKGEKLLSVRINELILG